jgi:hypothetical protein
MLGTFMSITMGIIITLLITKFSDWRYERSKKKNENESSKNSK